MPPWWLRSRPMASSERQGARLSGVFWRARGFVPLGAGLGGPRWSGWLSQPSRGVSPDAQKHSESDSDSDSDSRAPFFGARTPSRTSSVGCIRRFLAGNVCHPPFLSNSHLKPGREKHSVRKIQPRARDRMRTIHATDANEANEDNDAINHRPTMRTMQTTCATLCGHFGNLRWTETGGRRSESFTFRGKLRPPVRSVIR